MPLLGPVFYYDLVRQSRRRFIPRLRMVYLVGLFLILCVTGHSWSWFSSGDSLRSGSVARMTETFFTTFLIVQFLLVLGLTPALTAGAITEEKESQTLPFLLASPLHGHEIVLGKLVSRLLALALIVMAGLPVFSLLQLLGGVDPGWLWAGFLGTGATMLSLAAVSLFWSAVLPRSREAVLFAYLSFPAYLLLAQFSSGLLEPDGWAEFPSTATWVSPITLEDLVHAFNAGDPFSAMDASTASLGETLVTYGLFHAVVAVLAVAGAVLKLRRVSLSEAARPQKERRETSRSRPEVGDNPVLWRERHAERGVRLHWLARVLLAVLVFLSFLPVLDIFSADGEWLSLMMNFWVRITGTLVACLLLLAVAIRAACSVTAERQKQTLDVLLTTPVEPEQIVLAKWQGSLLSIRWGWLWLGAITGLGLLSGGLNFLALPLLCLCWASYAAFVAALGVRFSLRAPTSLRAMVLTVLTTGGLWMGPGLLMTCCGFLGAFGGGSEHLALFLGGLTPPIALGFLAFGYEEMRSANRYLGEMIVYSVVGAVGWGTAAALLLAAAREEFRKLVGRQR